MESKECRKREKKEKRGNDASCFGSLPSVGENGGGEKRKRVLLGKV